MPIPINPIFHNFIKEKTGIRDPCTLHIQFDCNFSSENSILHLHPVEVHYRITLLPTYNNSCYRLNFSNTASKRISAVI